MRSPARLPYLRACVDDDDTFLYDVFCTTWESEVAALPNPKLAQHVLRIQHIAQERRFRTRYPDHERYVVLENGEPAGRLYVQADQSSTQLIDLTLLPRFQSRGIGTQVVTDLCALAAEDHGTVSLRVPRRNVRATDFCMRLGFSLVTMDDLDNQFEWGTPATVPDPTEHDEAARAMKEGALDAVHAEADR